MALYFELYTFHFGLMSTLFQKIISGEIPSFKVWEDDAHYAFLTIEPIQPGHTLVVPKQPISHLFAMTDEAYIALMTAAKKVAELIQSKMKCEKVGVIVEGYGVKDYVHIHLVPLNGPGQLDFSLVKSTTTDQLTQIQKILRTSP